MGNAITLPAEYFKESLYKELVRSNYDYYVCALSDIPTLAGLFPEIEYFKSKPFKSGKGVVYRMPVYLENWLDTEKVKREVKALSNTIEPYTATTNAKVDTLERELRVQSEAIKERTPILKCILGPWIIKYFDRITSLSHDVDELKKESSSFVKIVNGEWYYMQTGRSPENIKKHLKNSRILAFDEVLQESIYRGYRAYLEAIKPFMKASKKLLIDRLAIAYALNKEGEQEANGKQVHGNTKITDEKIIGILKSSQAKIKTRSATYIHSRKGLEGRPNMRQLAKLIIKEGELDIDERTVQGRLKSLKEEVFNIVI